MQHVIILHTNDTHGPTDGLARIAALVAETRASNPGHDVHYFDCGDVEGPCRPSGRGMSDHGDIN